MGKRFKAEEIVMKLRHYLENVGRDAGYHNVFLEKPVVVFLLSTHIMRHDAEMYTDPS